MKEETKTDARGGRKGTDKLVIPIEVKCKCRGDHVEVTIDDGKADFSFRGSGVLYHEGDSMPAYVGQALLEEGCIVNLGECGPRVKMDWEGKLVIENCDRWVECDHDHLMGVAEGAAHVACPSEYYVTLCSIPEMDEDEEEETYVEFDYDEGSAAWMLKEDGGTPLVTCYVGDYLLPDIAQAMAEAGCHIELVTGYIEDQDVYEWKYDEDYGLMVKMGDSWEDDISEHFREVVKACETSPNPTACQLVLGKLPEKPDNPEDEPARRPTSVPSPQEGKVSVEFDRDNESAALVQQSNGNLLGTFYVGESLLVNVAQVLVESGCHIQLVTEYMEDRYVYEFKYDEEHGMMVKIGGSWENDSNESFRKVLDDCETAPIPTECKLVLSKLPEQPDETEDDGEQPQEEEGADHVDPRLLAKVKMKDGKVELIYREPQETMAQEEVYIEDDEVSLPMAQVLGELGCWISFTAGAKSMILRYQGGYWETWDGSEWNQSRDKSLKGLSLFHFAVFLDHSFRLAKVPDRDMEGRIYLTDESDVDIEWRNPLK